MHGKNSVLIFYDDMHGKNSVLIFYDDIPGLIQVLQQIQQEIEGD